MDQVYDICLIVKEVTKAIDFVSGMNACTIEAMADYIIQYNVKICNAYNVCHSVGRIGGAN